MNNLFHQKEFKIIHIDMDCFYAQVEMRDNPAIRNLPIGIGGPSKTKGVLCTSNYKAREYGVRAAMPTFKAYQKCPQLVLIPPNFRKYEEIASQIKEVFYRYTDKVQSISLDEAYLDVTDVNLFNGSATLIAKAIKDDIYKTTGLTASAGVSFNKMLAKIASDWRKPNGIYVITPEMRDKFMKDLPLSKIPGIGKVSSSKLARKGFSTCGDVTSKDIYDLFKYFKKGTALDLYEACQGISNSRVEPRSQRKSFGIERTFFEPVNDFKLIESEIDILIEKYIKRLEELSEFHMAKREISNLSIKLRFSNFETFTREKSIPKNLSNEIINRRSLNNDAIQIYKDLISNLYHNNKKPIRLIGLGIKFRDENYTQLDFNLA